MARGRLPPAAAGPGLILLIGCAVFTSSVNAQPGVPLTATLSPVNSTTFLEETLGTGKWGRGSLSLSMTVTGHQESLLREEERRGWRGGGGGGGGGL